MVNKSNSVLVIGFNTRPLAYSLNKAGYDVYAVDFFGDLDLFPFVKDNIIVIKELNKNYNSLKDIYSKHLVQFGIKLYRKLQDINFLLIGSGLDDAYEGRTLLLDEIKNSNTISINNAVDIITKSRDIELIYELLKSHGYNIPMYYSFEKLKSKETEIKYPFILKKKRSAGGMNVFRIDNETNIESQVQILKKKQFNPSEWIIQEYIKGTPISCTVISNGNECEVISINQQLIGEKFLNSPREFTYCGNIVPARLLKEERNIITEISMFLTKNLGLKGINGFDFVLQDHFPYFMECNPRIPGSIRASESVLNVNLLDLHIKSFIPHEWNNIRKTIRTALPKTSAIKFIFFAPKDIEKNLLLKISNLEFIHDKSEPKRNILTGEPLCTILYKAKTFSKAYNGAIEIVNKINRIID